MDLKSLYTSFFQFYGSQGWWPLLNLDPKINPTDRGRFTGYHPNDYKLPTSDNGIFEIMVGAILTQNTSWTNADSALGVLYEKKLLTPSKILATKTEKLAEYIKSSGYYNQKAIKLQNLANALDQTPVKILKSYATPRLRQFLLDIKGIGPETADSIVLYGFHHPVFVVDAYTKRLFSRLGFFDLKASYEDVQSLFLANLISNEEIFNEYHALIVQHSVKTCKRKPLCKECFLSKLCPKKIIVPKKRKTSNKKTK